MLQVTHQKRVWLLQTDQHQAADGDLLWSQQDSPVLIFTKQGLWIIELEQGVVWHGLRPFFFSCLYSPFLRFPVSPFLSPQ